MHSKIQTPLGAMTLWITPKGLGGAWFDAQAHEPAPGSLGPPGEHPWLDQAQAWLQAYFAGEVREVPVPLDDVRGTPFQREVWRLLRSLPYAQTSTYGQLAQLLGKPSASRAVGAAIGRNPLSIFVPCHRVLGARGAMTGYAGGVWRKQALLALEART